MTTQISPQEQATASLDFLYNAADEAVKYLSTSADKDIVQESEDLRFLVQESIDEIRRAAKRLDDLSVAEFHNRSTKNAVELLDELFEKTFGEK